jgi:hypothetical protein
MLSIIRVLTKTIVARFYERNAGLFFFVFFLMFGIVESSQVISYHQSLIYATLTAPVFLTGVCFVWFLYLLKCLQFIFSQLAKQENSFLFLLGHLDQNRKIGYIVVTILLIYEPVLIYTAFIIGLGLYSKLYVSILIILLFHIIGILCTTLLIVKHLTVQHQEVKLIKIPSLHWPWPKPFPVFYLSQLTHRLPTALFFTKAFSVFCIYGFLQLPLDHYESRLALLGVLMGLMSHAIIVFELRKFEETSLGFLRSLPIAMPDRLFNLSLMYLILLLPEICMLILRGVHFVDLMGVILFSTGYLVLTHCRLFYSVLNMDKHITWTLGLFLISFMLALFKLYLIETFMIWCVAYFWLQREYYQFELSNE